MNYEIMNYEIHVKGGHKEVPALAACRDDPVIPEPEVMFSMSFTILTEVNDNDPPLGVRKC